MKTGLRLIVLFALILSGCAQTTNAPATDVKHPTAVSVTEQPHVANSPSPSLAANASPETKPNARKAILTDVNNAVNIRFNGEINFAPAATGMELLPGGEIQTGVEGRARLDLQPEGTIVRVGPNSSFNLRELVEADGAPRTTLELLFGKVYILLNGGSLKVKTPGGVASVQGSIMSVEYNPETKGLKTTCLEGHCKMEDEDGNEVELTDEEMSFLFEDEPPTDPMLIDNEEIADWLGEIPEMPEFMEELPDPEDFPNPEFEFEMSTFEPEATLDPFATFEPEATEAPIETEEPATEDPEGGDDSGGEADPELPDMPDS